jgi:hypothetical protein
MNGFDKLLQMKKKLTDKFPWGRWTMAEYNWVEVWQIKFID